jgi:7-cyano-7-deazaguanine synthase
MGEKRAVAILSGGLDSTTAAFIGKREGYRLFPVHFNYRHRTEKRELEAFQQICDYLEIPQGERFVIDLPFFQEIGASALVDRQIEVPTDGLKPGIPVTYVPFRNGIFLSIAGAIGEKVGAEALFIGVVEEDSSGYPDCREGFIKSFEEALNLGTKPETKIEIKTPLIHRRKREIVQLALQLGVPVELTWSCYQGEEVACGLCDSCRLRLKGFAEAGVPDPLPYRAYPEWYPSHLRK